LDPLKDAPHKKEQQDLTAAQVAAFSKVRLDSSFIKDIQ
jgi:hypothetical protein